MKEITNPIKKSISHNFFVCLAFKLRSINTSNVENEVERSDVTVTKRQRDPIRACHNCNNCQFCSLDITEEGQQMCSCAECRDCIEKDRVGKHTSK